MPSLLIGAGSETRGLNMATGSKMRVWSSISVIGLVSGWVENGRSGFGVLISFSTIKGERTRICVRRSELEHPGRLWDRLLDAGLPQQSDETRKRVLARLRDVESAEEYVAVERPGWSGMQYVWPDGAVSGEGKRLLLQSHVETGVRHSRGTLKEWVRTVASPARHSTPMIFAISFALGAYLLKDTGVEGGIVHLTSSEAGAGKSLTQLVAQSVGRQSSRRTMTHWDATETASEELAVDHNDGLLILDEIARLAPTPAEQATKAEAASFRMAGGVSRLRSRRYASERASNWRVLVLSSGETSISGLADRVGRRRLQGDAVRTIDLPAVRRAKRGVFDRLPASRLTTRVAAKIERGVARNYGVAGRAFVKAYLRKPDQALDRVNGWRKEFVAKSGIGAESWERRFGSRFALAYAAAMLAREFDILPWSAERTLRALQSAYRDARAAVQGENVGIAPALQRLRRRVGSKLAQLRSDEGRPPRAADRRNLARNGYVRLDSAGNREYVIRPKALRRWVSSIVSPQSLLSVLRAKGALVTGARGKMTTQVVMPGEKVRSRVYRVTASKL